ncbi:MAG: hypothetical protein ABEK50_06555 [bacterium]
MVSIDKISQQALERIGIEDHEYDDCWTRATNSTFEGQAVENIETVRAEPGIQGRPFPVITGHLDRERLWWDPQSSVWVRKPIFEEENPSQ